MRFSLPESFLRRHPPASSSSGTMVMMFSRPRCAEVKPGPVPSCSPLVVTTDRSNDSGARRFRAIRLDEIVSICNCGLPAVYLRDSTAMTGVWGDSPHSANRDQVSAQQHTPGARKAKRPIATMSSRFFDPALLDSPDERPSKRWEPGDDGPPSGRILDACRRAQFIPPIPKPRKSRSAANQQTFVFADDKGLSRDLPGRWSREPCAGADQRGWSMALRVPKVSSGSGRPGAEVFSGRQRFWRIAGREPVADPAGGTR